MGTKDLQKKRKNKESPMSSVLKLVEKDKLEFETKKKQRTEKRKRKTYNKTFVGIAESAEDNLAQKTLTKKTKKSSKKKKLNNAEGVSVLVENGDQLSTKAKDGIFDQSGNSKKIQKKKIKDQVLLVEGEKPAEKHGESGNNSVSHIFETDDVRSRGLRGRSKEAKKKKKRDRDCPKEAEKFHKTVREDEKDGVYVISSVDGDCSKGMEKWIAQYHQNRPGLKVLQQRIDEFITAHEAKLEQERKEREAQAAEGGWTVVTHHKGRKKTTDAESGITVSSVAQAVAEHNMSKKKSKEVGLDFYRFQRKEARRNEIMMLQSKFEQDKKRIQQLRAARKFCR